MEIFTVIHPSFLVVHIMEFPGGKGIWLLHILLKKGLDKRVYGMLWQEAWGCSEAADRHDRLINNTIAYRRHKCPRDRLTLYFYIPQQKRPWGTELELAKPLMFSILERNLPRDASRKDQIYSYRWMLNIFYHFNGISGIVALGGLGPACMIFEGACCECRILIASVIASRQRHY